MGSIEFDAFLDSGLLVVEFFFPKMKSNIFITH